MKKTDIALIIIIISVSVGLAWAIGSATIGKSNKQPIQVRTIEKFSSEDVQVDESIFHKDAINPTVEANIKGYDLTSIAEESTENSDTSSEAETGGQTEIQGQTEL